MRSPGACRRPSVEPERGPFCYMFCYITDERAGEKGREMAVLSVKGGGDGGIRTHA